MVRRKSIVLQCPRPKFVKRVSARLRGQDWRYQTRSIGVKSTESLALPPTVVRPGLPGPCQLNCSRIDWDDPDVDGEDGFREFVDVGKLEIAGPKRPRYLKLIPRRLRAGRHAAATSPTSKSSSSSSVPTSKPTSKSKSKSKSSLTPSSSRPPSLTVSRSSHSSLSSSSCSQCESSGCKCSPSPSPSEDACLEAATTNGSASPEAAGPSGGGRKKPSAAKYPDRQKARSTRRLPVTARTVRLEVCPICLDHKPCTAFPHGRVAPRCEHSDRACFACFSTSIDAQLDEKYPNELACPLCSSRLDYEAVEEFASLPTFTRYDALLSRQCLTSMAGWWDCPNAKCTFGGLYDQTACDPRVWCLNCKQAACLTCGVPWHKGWTCEAYQASQRALKEAAERQRVLQGAVNKKNNAASEVTVQKTTKSCPNQSCSVRIEKNSGCQHMKCSQCRHQFCWDCCASWVDIMKEGNTAHSTSCRWHTLNLRN